MDYILRGRKANGDTVYYTGKAGAGFIHESLLSAFSWAGQEGARRRAMNLNQMTAIHGVHFIALEYSVARQEYSNERGE